MKTLTARQLASIFLLISAAGSAVLYILHVIVGGVLDPNYNQLSNSISALTAVGAPNQNVLLPMLNWYGWLYIIFCILLVSLFWKNANKLAIIGAVLLTISSLISKIGFGVFGFDGEAAGLTYSNIMHITVVAVVVVFTIAALYSIAFAYLRLPKDHVFGIYLLVLAIIFTVAGGAAGYLTANNSQLMGVVEKINLGALQLFVLSLGIYLLNASLAIKKLAISSF